MFANWRKRAADAASAAAAVANSAAKKASATATAAMAAANLDRLQAAGASASDDTSGSGQARGGGSASRGGGREGGASAGGGTASSGARRQRTTTGRGSPIPAAFVDLDFSYITDRIIAMGPLDKSPNNRLAPEFLRTRHSGQFMVLNMSERSYDYEPYDNQVMEFKFAGHPAPPLGMMCKMCTFMDSWLAADPANVVVVHCMTGRGRTITLLACYLAWIGRYYTPLEALMHVCEQRGVPMEKVIVPSQSRYAYYFTTLMDGIKPRPESLVLRRVIVNGLPDMSGGSGSDDNKAGCRPFLQLFQNGKLLFSSTWAHKDSSLADGASDPADAYRWYAPADGSVKFDVGVVLQGDVLMRCRHKRRGGKKSVAMFRAAFHTGYTPELVLRFSLAQLEGTSAARYPDDFFVELIFAPVDASGDAVSAAAAVEGGIVVSSADKPAYDAMLAHKSQFWDQIATRKAERARARADEDAALKLAAASNAMAGAGQGASTGAGGGGAGAGGAGVSGSRSAPAAGEEPSFMIDDAPPSPVVREAPSAPTTTSPRQRGAAALVPSSVDQGGSAAVVGDTGSTQGGGGAGDDALDHEMALLEQELGLEVVSANHVDVDVSGTADTAASAGSGGSDTGAAAASQLDSAPSGSGGEAGSHSDADTDTSDANLHTSPGVDTSGMTAEEQEIAELERYLDSL